MPRESKTGKNTNFLKLTLTFLGAHLPNERRLSLELFRSPSEAHPLITQITSYWLYLISSDVSGAAPNQLIVNGNF